MSHTQQQLADLFKKLIPTATENDSSVTVVINGISISLPKNTSKTQVSKGNQSVFR